MHFFVPVCMFLILMFSVCFGSWCVQGVLYSDVLPVFEIRICCQCLRFKSVATVPDSDVLPVFQIPMCCLCFRF